MGEATWVTGMIGGGAVASYRTLGKACEPVVWSERAKRGVRRKWGELAGITGGIIDKGGG